MMRLAFHLAFLLLSLGWYVSVSHAEDLNDLKEQIAEQKRQMAEQNERLQRLEARLEQAEQQEKQTLEITRLLREETAWKSESALPPNLRWLETVKLFGDFRYRQEMIDAENTPDRNRARIRARVGLTAKVNDDVDFGFRLATATDSAPAGGDPVSTNQTLGGGFSKKSVWVDWAYLDWHPATVKGLDVIAGKMENPFYNVGRNEVIWDVDLTFEGIAGKYVRPVTESDDVFINGGGFWVEEFASEADQSLWGEQVGWNHKFNRDTNLLGGVSLYQYGNLQDRELVYDRTKSFGNTTSIIGGKKVYASEFDPLEVFAEQNFKALGLPMGVYGNYVNNVAASTRADEGWIVGWHVGKLDKPGAWTFDYSYREVDADAVVGAFTSSDFIGGGTNARGHTLGAGYQISRNVAAAATFFCAERGNDDAYHRLELDMNVKF
jgi:hypothetical protein